MKVKVISVFQDKHTQNLYKVGEVIEIEDEERVEDLASRGLAESIEERKAKTISLFEKEFEKKAIVEAMKTIGERAVMNMKEETLLANIAALDEEKALALKEALGVEA